MRYLIPILLAGMTIPAQASPQTQAEERVLDNGKLRIHLRSNLTVTVEDLATNVTWGSDPWENSAGRIHLRGKHGEAVNVSLSSAVQKKLAPGPGTHWPVCAVAAPIGTCQAAANPRK